MTTYTRAMRGLLRRLTAVNVTNRGFDASRDPRSTFRVIPDDELYVGGDEGFVSDPEAVKRSAARD